MARRVYRIKVRNPISGAEFFITANSQSSLQNKLNKFNGEIAKTQETLKAAKETIDAQNEIKKNENLLNKLCLKDYRVDWNRVYDNNKFERSEPVLNDFFKSGFVKQELRRLPLFKKRIEETEKNAKVRLEEALASYEDDKKKFYEHQEKENKRISDIRVEYEKGLKKGIIEYFDLMLKIPENQFFQGLEYAVGVEIESKLLVIEVDLPPISTISKVVEKKYSQGKIVEKEMRVREFEEYYNNILFQIILLIIQSIFVSDYKNQIETVVVNGLVEGIDPKTGKDFRNCILSIQTNRGEFSKVDLCKVKAQECFRFLKGVSAGSLVSLSPVKPIMKLNDNDSRLIAADEVIDGLTPYTNLALMDWQDFETLVRDLFQKIYPDSKVEVTRTSRDLGVDAIVYDEDPIKGGKVVIQAKRYNHLVPVSAVRDLYGTVQNEGAIKGILVTTSYYGPEALEFVKDKPLKLINGEELIYLFNQYGYTKLNIELVKKLKT